MRYQYGYKYSYLDEPVPTPAPTGSQGYLDVIFIGGGIVLAAAIIGGLYCASKKGSEFCQFPCEPFFGICENRRLRRTG